MGGNAYQSQEKRPNPSDYKCGSCGFVAPTRLRLDDHMFMHSDTKTFVCSFQGCKYKTKYPRNLKQHGKRHNPVSATRHKCSVCAKGFCFPSELKKHARIHAQQKEEIPCSLCTQKFSNRFNLIQHVRRRHTHEKTVCCRQCDKKFKDHYSLNIHLIEEHGRSAKIRQKKYKCDFCDLRVPYFCTLRDHMKVHSDDKPFTCSLPACGFRTKYLPNLQQHEIRHDPALSTRFKCPMCQKGFPFRYQMDRHVRTHVHEDLRQCPECDFKLVGKTGLKVHIEKMHRNYRAKKTMLVETEEPEDPVIPHEETKGEDGSKMYKCLFAGCAYQTRFSANMSKHKTVHKPRNANNLLKCHFPGCGVEIKWRYYYKKHLKLHEPNRQKTYECPLCAKKYWSASGLSSHKKTHTDEKTHKCQYCDYACAEYSILSGHHRKFHRYFLLNVPTGDNAGSTVMEPDKNLLFKEIPKQQLHYHAKSIPVVILKRLIIFK